MGTASSQQEDHQGLLLRQKLICGDQSADDIRTTRQQAGGRIIPNIQGRQPRRRLARSPRSGCLRHGAVAAHMTVCRSTLRISGREHRSQEDHQGHVSQNFTRTVRPLQLKTSLTEASMAGGSKTYDDSRPPRSLGRWRSLPEQASVAIRRSGGNKRGRWTQALPLLHGHQGRGLRPRGSVVACELGGEQNASGQEGHALDFIRWIDHHV